SMIENAVRDFLNALGPDLRRRALFPFEAEERFNWHYIPRERNGVMLKAMNDAQRQAAMALLRAALSERGYSRAEDIMWLENVLAEIENDPETYGPSIMPLRCSASRAERVRGAGASTGIIRH